MILEWFDAREAVKMGASMAKYFSQRVALDTILASDKKSMRKIDEVISKLRVQAERFKVDHKPNIFKKSKLANEFQWRLLDMGYDKKYVDEIAKEVLLRL